MMANNIFKNIYPYICITILRQRNNLRNFIKFPILKKQNVLEKNPTQHNHPKSKFVITTTL